MIDTPYEDLLRRILEAERAVGFADRVDGTIAADDGGSGTAHRPRGDLVERRHDQASPLRMRSAVRNASSIDCRPFRRGSQTVS